MKKPDHPVFLERQSYRRRRMMDGARFAPVVAALLFCLPLLWGAQGTVPTTRALIYIFLAWGGLVVASAMLARHLRRIPREPWEDPR